MNHPKYAGYPSWTSASGLLLAAALPLSCGTTPPAFEPDLTETAALSRHARPAPPRPAPPASANGAPRAAVGQDEGPREAEEFPVDARLADYLAWAERENPGLGAAMESWYASRERVPEVRALPDPTLAYRYYVDEVETRVGPQEQAVSLNQTIPWFGKRHLRGQVAEEWASSLGADYEQKRLALRAEVQHAYFEFYFVTRSIDVVQRNLELVANLEEVARGRYRVGAAKHPDVIRAQVELGRLDDQLRTLIDRSSSLVAYLNSLLARAPKAPLPAPTAPDFPPIEETEAELLARAETNPGIRLLEHVSARAEREVDLARKDFYPDFTFGISYIDTGEARDSGTPQSGKDPLSLSVSLNLPLQRSKYHAGLRAARREKLAATKRLENHGNALRSQALEALYELRDAERRISLYRDTLLPRAQQSLAASDAAFRTGEASFLELVDSERLLLEFELAYERARADQGQGRARLERILGGPLRPSVSTPASTEVER